MAERKKTFKRITGDGSTIAVVGTPDTATASAFGDLFSDGLDYAWAVAKAEISFKQIEPQVQKYIERDIPGSFVIKQNVCSVISDVLRGEFAKQLLSKPKKEILDKIDDDTDKALKTRKPLNTLERTFVENIFETAVKAFPAPNKISPQ